MRCGGDNRTLQKVTEWLKFIFAAKQFKFHQRCEQKTKKQNNKKKTEWMKLNQQIFPVCLVNQSKKNEKSVEKRLQMQIPSKNKKRGKKEEEEKNAL